MISKLVTFADAVLTVSSFSLDETIANTYFLVMYCCGQLIHCLKISENKNNLRHFEAEIAKKLRTAEPQPKVTGSYEKKRVHDVTVCVCVYVNKAKLYPGL